MVVERSPDELRLAHIHLGVDGGAERFFVRLAGALNRRGVRQIAFIRPDRAWRDDLAKHCEVREIRFSRSHLKRRIIRYNISRTIRKFGATATLGWMSPASKWMPSPGPNMSTFVRLGDFPDTFRTYGNVEHLIGNTPEIIRQAVEMGWPASRAHMISNFVEDHGVATTIDRQSVGTPEDAFVIVALGRFVERKRFDLLIRAVANLPNAQAWLIGDGEKRDELVRLAADCGIADRVRFLGWQRDPWPYLASADALACPSDEEPLGNVILEGWHFRLPVVATASAGPRWLIQHGTTGLLSECGNAAELGQSICRLQNEPNLRNLLAEQGRQELDLKFAEDPVCNAYLKLLFG